MAFTVTATPSGSSSGAEGVYLLVKVLTGATAAGGASVGSNSATGATAQGSVTPAGTNSLILYALSGDNITAGMPAAAASNTYYTPNSGNSTHGYSYAHGFYSGAVTAGTPVTAGAGANTGQDHSNWAIYEILASGGSTPVVDASSPAFAAGTDSATAATTASFTPPAGSVLVAMVIAGGLGTGTGITMTITDTAASGLVWTRRAVSNTTDNFQPCWVYTTTMAGPSGGPVRLPQQISRMGSRRRRSSQRPQFNQQLPGATVNPFAPVPVTVSVPVPSVSVAKPFITGIAGTGTGQYFKDQQGNPILVKGDTVWGFLTNAGNAGEANYQAAMDYYTATRAGQGYNAFIVCAACSQHYNGNGNNTWDGVAPFTSTSPVTFNSTYWARVDYLVSSAAAQGMTLFLNPAPTFSCNDAGALFTGWSTTQFTQYGALIGARYASALNIVWFFGDDYSGVEGTGDASYNALLSAMKTAGANQLVCIENNLESDCRFNLFDSSACTFGTSNASFNFVYSYNADYDGVIYAYRESSPLCVLRGDGNYDNATGGSRPDEMRNLLWWALSSGSRGYMNGREGTDLWPASGHADIVDAAYFQQSQVPSIFAAFSALPGWHRLVPDADSGGLVTAGRGTKLPIISPGNTYQNNSTYVTASITAAGDLAVIYIPSNVTITVNGALMQAGYTATWIDPVNGATSPATIAATYNNPSSNSIGQADWVLALQGPPPAPVLQTPVPWMPPGWFPGADKVTAVPGGIPFAQVPAPADQNAPVAAPALTVNAGLATGTGTAQQPVIAIGPNGALAAGTAAAQGDDVSASFTPAVAANAGLAAGTGTAQAPVAAIGANDALATGTGTAQGDDISASFTPAVTVNAGLATGTGTAQQPQVLLTYPLAPEYPVLPLPPGWFPGADAVITQPGGLPFYAQPGPADPVVPLTSSVTVNAGLAAGAGAAQSPAVAIAANDSAGPALAAGTGQAPAPAIAANAGLAAATGTAQTAVSAIAVSAGLATGTGTAQSPAAAEAANAGLAAGTGAAQSPAAAIGANDAAGPASGTGTSQAPAPAVAVNAGLATATGTALQAATTQPAPASTFVPLPLVPGWFPGADAVTTEPGGIPFLVQPQPADQNAALGGAPLAVSAGLASAAGTAQAPAVAIAPNAGLAAATGTAQTATAAIGVNDATGPAPGTGAAQSPLTATGANAGLSAGTGTAQQPSAATAVPAGLATAAGTAQQPVPALGANDATGPATAAGTSQAPSAAIAVNDATGPALGTGTALPVSTAVPAPPPPGPAVLLPPGWFPGSDRATAEPGGIPFWQAPQPADPVGAVPAIAVTAGLATATGTAQAPAVAIAAAAAQATGTAAAQPPAAGVSANTGLATVTGTALAALAAAGANAALAAGTGIAQPTAFDYANARVATATGAALQPLVTVAAAVVKGSSTATVTEQAGMAAAVTEAAGMSATVTAPASSKPGVS